MSHLFKFSVSLVHRPREKRRRVCTRSRSTTLRPCVVPMAVLVVVLERAHYRYSLSTETTGIRIRTVTHGGQDREMPRSKENHEKGIHPFMFECISQTDRQYSRDAGSVGFRENKRKITKSTLDLGYGSKENNWG